jgi:hypothetical protein
VESGSPSVFRLENGPEDGSLSSTSESLVPSPPNSDEVDRDIESNDPKLLQMWCLDPESTCQSLQLIGWFRFVAYFETIAVRPYSQSCFNDLAPDLRFAAPSYRWIFGRIVAVLGCMIPVVDLAFWRIRGK